VLLLHNRYRVTGGEERSVELQMRALDRAGVPNRLLERRSDHVGKGRAALALVRGGDDAGEVSTAVRDLGATVAHAHNTLPLLGVRGLEAAQAAGARVVLHLHNVRLFCATGFGERNGAPCFRCHHRLTLPGLALNCRGSVPEAAAYATALSVHHGAMLAVVDRFVAPSTWAAGQVVKLGLPADKVEALPHYLPAEDFAARSRAGEGSYLIVVSRLSQEKGIDDAIAAAAAAGAPLKIAGDGPDRERLEQLAGPDVEFLGRVSAPEVRDLLDGAAAVLMPSRYHEFAPYSALEAAARGVPVAATAMGGLPELLGPAACVPRGDMTAFAERVRAVWGDAGARAGEGDELLARVRGRHSEEAHVRGLLGLYARL
jgi:glycosyltransferase involved in cell wall biosynthesis